MNRLLVALVPLVAVVGAGAALATRGADEPPAVEAAPDPTPLPLPSQVVVDVAGAVAHPGVVRLPVGSRVMDALAAAGGTTADADPSALNRAAPLRDGTRIYVPRPGEIVPAGAAGSTAETKVNLNSATAIELASLPGIGPNTAARIIRAREAKPFARPDELQTRALVSPRVFADLRDLVTVR